MNIRDRQQMEKCQTWHATTLQKMSVEDHKRSQEWLKNPHQH